ncbi:aminoglycoside phosphotransferase family protein [Kribbella deserti]|uniref:Aminoglycoside phosphotransferase family protein n=1 Tax=Kribbella deserti TaxID=1926257 RepID=A0ABV6QTM3_9ACTN
MTEYLTADQLTARTEHAIATAAEAARDLGVEVTDPTALYDAFSVVVHLKPSPVVARIPIVLPPEYDPATQAGRQRTELDVVAWLLGQGHPVVPPSPLVPLEPVRRDGLSMTFWQYVEVAGEPDWAENTRRSADLHQALAEYQGALQWMAPINNVVPQALAALEGKPELLDPADLDRAKREWELLEPVLGSRAGWEREFPTATVQPIHGDAPAYNMIMVGDGALWADFEDVTAGPVEWDFALFPPEIAELYNEAAEKLGMRGLDERALAVMGAARNLQVVACMPLVPQFPALGEGLQPVIDGWRASPLAGGLAD